MLHVSLMCVVRVQGFIKVQRCNKGLKPIWSKKVVTYLRTIQDTRVPWNLPIRILCVSVC